MGVRGRRKQRAAFAAGMVLAVGCYAAQTLTGCGAFGGGVDICADGTFEPSYTRSVDLERWRSFPIQVYIGGDTLFNGEVDLREAIQQGIGGWTDATAGVVQYEFTDRKSRADITIEVKQPDRAPDPRHLAKTTTYTRGRRLTGAHITLPIWRGLMRTEAFNLCRDAAGHEMGHALGIQGHSDSPHDLMYPTLSGVYYPTTRDANTIKTAYCDLFDPSRAACLSGSNR